MFNRKAINLRKIITFFIVPLGTLCFLLFTLYKFGDFFAYFTVRSNSWGVHFTNPFPVFWEMFSSTNKIIRLIFLYFLFYSFLNILILISKLPLIYKLSGIFFTFIPLFSGLEAMKGFMRVSVVVFPIYVYFSGIGGKYKPIFITAVFIILQIILMSFWSNGLLFI